MTKIEYKTNLSQVCNIFLGAVLQTDIDRDWPQKHDFLNFE